MTAVNPHEGQVAIPSPRPPGHVVGRLGARAMAWVEDAIGKPIDDIYDDIRRRMTAAMLGEPVPAVFPVAVAAAVLWAGIEHERRMSNGPGPEFTIDDAYELIDHNGLDAVYQYTLTLIQLSLPFKQRVEQLEQAAAAAGEPSPVDPLRAAAMIAGTGTPTSQPLSPPVSPPSPPGT